MDFLPILERLIAFNTISSESNLALIDYAEKFLSDSGFELRRIYNREGNKANLLARIGPQGSHGILLAGHSDVVPVKDQPWTSDPFQMRIEGDRCHGRGSADMKGFLAVFMDIAQMIDPATLNQPLYLLLTYDEEVGCWGAKALKNELRTLGPELRLALIGEPTDMALATSHKGIQLTRTCIHGKSAHSSRPDLGSNAISHAARVINKIPELLSAQRNPRFSPPQTTFNIGTIHGGSATNIIAEHCVVEWEIRPLPDSDPENFNRRLNDFSDRLQADHNDLHIENKVLAQVPGLKDDINQQAVSWLQTFLPDAPINTVPFTTEAGIFQQAGIPTVVCGPGRLDQAHQPDEFVSLRTLQDCQAFLQRIIENS